jgi:hypothetical protein
MAVVPKGGLSVAGHKIPWEAIAALAGVAGVILIIRARQQGSNVAAVGQAPATAADTGFGAAGFTPDNSAQLADLSAQITSLQQSLAGAPAPSGAAAATPEMAIIRAFGSLAGTAFGGWDTSGHSGPPAYTNPNGTGPTIDLPFGSSWQVLGFQNGLEELLGPAGQDVWINPRDISGYIGPAPTAPTSLNSPTSPVPPVHGFRNIN